MSLFSARHATITSAEQLIPSRMGGRRGSVSITNDSALRHSAVWACLRLRADMVSMMPVDAYRPFNGMQVEIPKPLVLINTGGDECRIVEWMYSTQFDVDRAGNVFGLITQRDALGLPSRIELQDLAGVSVICRGPKILEIRIHGKPYPLKDIWHEKQFTVSGLPLGLSPVAYSAWSAAEYLSIQDFALDWFGNSAIPAATLKHTKESVPQREAEVIKARYKASVAAGDLFVHGADWEYKPINSLASQSQWIEAKAFGLTDISRFFGAPADLIDAAVQNGSLTYGNITQRNLQFLIMNLAPTVNRRENALTTLLPGDRFIKLNTDAVLRMDPEMRARTIQMRIDSRTLAPSEARKLENLQPFTAAQIAEFDQLFPYRQPAIAKPGAKP